ncbi:MAG: imidazole glycerol phosphate synthase subunit HisH [Saprospiraceae bacterium]|nr:imidazole glycerol phosphate synthase subunit HisH [Saprospiraceae bacterium]
MIGIINYGMGNVGSIQNMIRHVGGESIIIDDPDQIRGVDKVIIPGVGAFDNGMTKLHARGFVQALDEHVERKGKPVLGICLGMQLLTMASEEGEAAGLGWIRARAVKFQFNGSGESKLRVPHMGWNAVTYRKETAINKNTEEEPRYYFVHTYHVVCEDEQDVLCTCEYGHTVVAGIARSQIYGLQFHPEKSHKYGMTILRNFSNL